MRTLHFGLLGCLAVAGAAGAAEPRELLQPPKREIASPLTDHFSLRGSWSSASVTTNGRLDTSLGLPGTAFSGEDDLGLEDRAEQGTLEIILRLRERSRVRIGFFRLARDGDRQIDRTIQFGDDTFLASDRVVSNVEWQMFDLTYTYSLFKSERFELAGGLGLHLIQADAGGAVTARQLQQDFSAAGPFPTLAVDGVWRISSRFALSARAQRLNASIGDFDGGLAIYHADLQYRWRRNLAVGLGYTQVKIGLQSSDAEFPGRFDLDVKGPEVFLRVSF